MNDITPKEAIANLNHIYGMVAPDIQRSLDVAIKALERPQGDCISREAINSEIEKRYCSKHCVVPSEEPYCPDICPARFLKDIVKECPPTPERPQGDLISREALKKAVKNRFDNSEYFPFHFLALIDNAQAVDLWQMRQEATENALKKAEALYGRPKGEWIIVKDEKYGNNVKCPFCGKELAGTDLNFCCKCGADMRPKGGKE